MFDNAILERGVRPFTIIWLGILCVVLTGHAFGDVDVPVGRFEPAGTGANLEEMTLNSANVNPSHFGKLFSYEVEGFVYAQPLIVSGISVRGRVRNVLYVATMNNLVYALDADDPGPNGGLLWSVRFSEHGAFPVPDTINPPAVIDPNFLPYGHRTVQGNYGVWSTPVVDRTRNTIYLVAHTIESGNYIQRLHALDLVTGREKAASPVVLGGSVVNFNPKIEGNRSGLALVNSKVIIAWGAARKDLGDYNGWVMTYDADTLDRSGVFCTTYSDRGGGIWQSGRPPAVDGNGNVYFFVGNGSTKDNCNVKPVKPVRYYGESLLKLDPNNGDDPGNSLKLVGSWTPRNWCELDGADADLGGSGPVLINVSIDGQLRTLAVGGGKEGLLYVIETGGLKDGQEAVGDPLQSVDLGPTQVDSHGQKTKNDWLRHIMGGPVYWQRPTEAGGSLLYVSAENEPVRMYEVANSTSRGGMVINPKPKSMTSIIEGHPGAILSLSANAHKANTGIIWMNYASDNTIDFGKGAVFSTKRGRLAAFDAENLGRLLWNSDMVPHRDALGYFAKFNPPTIANGKVYVAAFPSPEPYMRTLDAEYGPPYALPIRVCISGCINWIAPQEIFKETYHAPNNMGYIVVYGLNPPENPPVKSFVADLLPSILYPMLYH